MKIPLHLVTGFLGAGKTTLLRALLRDPSHGRVAVLINEVGDLALDHHLVEVVDEGVLVFASGCVCCTLHGELFGGIARSLRLAPDRIVLETTGLADPAPIVSGLALHPELRDQVALAGVIAVIDAERGEALLEEPEAAAQVALADRIVVSKVDLAPGRAGPLRARLLQMAPAAEVVEASQGQVDPAWVLAPSAAPGLAAGGRATAWLHHHQGGPHALTARIALPEPVDLPALTLALRLITQLDGEDLLRVKGVVRDRSGGAWVVQAVQQAVAPPRSIAGWPPDFGTSALVLIARPRAADLLPRWRHTLELAAAGR